MKWTADLFLFTWTAGTLDGLSYLRSQVFTANMTGNTVLLGLHLVQGEFDAFLRNLTALAGFAIGCLLAVLLFDDLSPPRTAKTLVLSARIQLPLLLTFAGLWLKAGKSQESAFAIILLAAASMGIQSVAVKRLKIHGVATTFITGTVTETVTESTRAVRSRFRYGTWPPWSSKSAHLWTLLATYLAAAATAGYLSIHWSTGAAFLSLPTLAAVALRSR